MQSSHEASLQAHIRDCQSEPEQGSPLNLQEEQPLSPQPRLPTALASKGTKRGRKAQDPHQVLYRRECASQQMLENELSAFLQDPGIDRQHTLFEATLPVGAAFLVDYGPAASGAAKSNSYKYGPAFAPGVGPAKEGHVARSMSVMEALSQTPEDPKERMRKQRAISRSVENAVEHVDGHRYAFHNEWLARDNDAYRFSYFCNDSLLNKDRTLGGVKKNDESKVKRARKQVYDCQGYLTIKFSATKHHLEVIYKHIPVHPTYDERAPVPRVGTKRFEILQRTDPNHELIQRAKEREARKHVLATKAGAKPLRRQSSRPDPSDPETPGPRSGRRKSPEDGDDIAPDSSTGFRFRNLTVDTHPSAKKAKTQATKNSEAGGDAGRPGDNEEMIRLRAELDAAQQIIRNLQTQSPGAPTATGAQNGFQSYPPPSNPSSLPQNTYERPSSYAHRSHPYANEQRTDAESIAAAASSHPPPADAYPPPNPQQHQGPYYGQSPQQPTPMQLSNKFNSRPSSVQFNHYQPSSPHDPSSLASDANAQAALDSPGSSGPQTVRAHAPQPAGATSKAPRQKRKTKKEMLADAATTPGASEVAHAEEGGQGDSDGVLGTASAALDPDVQD